MKTALGAVADAVGLTTTPDDYQEAVNAALLTYGADDIAGITGRENIQKLRALAKIEAWKLVLAQTAGDFDFRADGGSYNRSQIYAQAVQSLLLAELDAMALGALIGYQVGVDKLVHIHDPYIYLEDDDRTAP